MKRLLPLLAFAAVCRAATSERPNILVIVADDLGYSDLGAYGGCEVKTLHLDTLAANGIRLRSGYVASPVCSPSRAGLLTGVSPTRFGHEFNPHAGDEATLGLPLDRRTIADSLRSVGYATALFGKWHQGFSPTHHPLARGFDEFVGFLVGGHNYQLNAAGPSVFGPAHSLNMIYRGRELLHLNGYSTDLFTDEAIAFMSRPRSQPWFVYLAFNAVHSPLEQLGRHRSRIPEAVKNPERRGYLSLLLGLDDAVGRVIDCLHRTGQTRNTLVVFFSDNGGSGHKPFYAYNTATNAPLRGDKGQVLEGGVRVPFVLVWPEHLPAGKTDDRPVTTLDILPTACALAGAPIPADTEGVNLLPFLGGDNDTEPHHELAWRFGTQRALRRGNWKVVDWRDHERKMQSGWELYDLSADTGEHHNLAAAHPEKLAELIAAWECWNARNIVPAWQDGLAPKRTAPLERSASR